MMKSLIKNIRTLLLVITTFHYQQSEAQVARSSELFQTLKAIDSLMFEVGFNECNLDQIASLLPEDFEFYHDKDGMIRSKAGFLEKIEKNICSSGKNNVRRVLEENSVEVFALHDQGEPYGAIMTAQHKFGNTTARFTNLFLLKEGEWKPIRIFSYDHRNESTSVNTDVSFINLTTSELSQYLGNYKFSPEFVLSIIMEGNKIYGDAQGQKVEILPYGDHRFLDETKTMNLEFIQDEPGVISGLKMSGPDGDMTALKLN